MTGSVPAPSRRQAARAERGRAEEARWQQRRFAVPHRVDGPKITLGVAWFLGLLASVTAAPWLVALFVVPAAGLAAMQCAHAWARVTVSDHQLAAAFAALMALSGLAGDTLWVGAAVLVGTAAILLYAFVAVGSAGDPLRFAEVMVRSTVPPAVAAASLMLLAVSDPGPFVALLLLVSAYETGDFIVGSGAANDVEGPAAGLVALGMVGFGVWLLPPAPLTETDVPFFVALTALCCPLGQLLASAMLPRGDAAAPALRRLDSHLLAAVLWLLLI